MKVQKKMNGSQWNVFFLWKKKYFPVFGCVDSTQCKKVNRFSSGGIFCFIVFFAGFADELLGVRADEVFVLERTPVV
jgi:hypothetical protein